MKRKSDDELREQYPYLFDGEDGAETAQIVRILDAGFNAVDPPHNFPPVLGPAQPSKSTSAAASIYRPRWTRTFAVPAAALLIVVAAAVAFALSNITNLGKPANTPPPDAALPLSGFHRTPLKVRNHGKPALVFIGTQLDQHSGIERWAVVKALDQFGTLSHVTPSMATFGGDTAVATFDWSRARYSSRYITFLHADLLNTHGRPYQHLSPLERSLYNRYARPPKSRIPDDPDHVRAAIFPGPSSNRRLPLIYAGGYVETLSQFLIISDFAVLKGSGNSYSNFVPLSFDAIRQALVTGKEPANGRLVTDVNAEANVITALICHADGKKPRSVCSRSVVKAILRHVR